MAPILSKRQRIFAINMEEIVPAGEITSAQLCMPLAPQHLLCV
ncbi:MAG: hypothetical protein WBM41_12675 [Arenicellales bacterium]